MKDKYYAVYRLDYRGESNPYIRVSDSVYKTENEAKEECAYWQDILCRFPDGTKVVIR